MNRRATLGHRYRDPITGFEGIATANHTYLYMCCRTTLSGVNSQTGEPADFTFDFPSCSSSKTVTCHPRQSPPATCPDEHLRSAHAQT